MAVAQAIGTRILSSDLQPGSLIPGEVEASANLRISRTTYRESVRILVSKGLIESRPRLGTRVTAVEQWQLLDHEVIAWLSASGAAERYQPALVELGEIVEPEAAYLSATRRNRGHVQQLKGHVLRVTSLLASCEEREDAATELRKLLGRASGNQFVSVLVDRIASASRVAPSSGAIVGRFVALVQAIERQDPEGARNQMRSILEEMMLASPDDATLRRFSANRRGYSPG